MKKIVELVCLICLVSLILNGQTKADEEALRKLPQAHCDTGEGIRVVNMNCAGKAVQQAPVLCMRSVFILMLL